MNKTKSIVAIIMVMLITLIGFTACNNNRKCKDKEKCEQASCCKKGDKNCGKDSATCAKAQKSECCKKDSTKH